MAAIANDIDRFLAANPITTDPAASSRLLLIATTSPGGFKVAQDGTPSPASIQLSAAPVNLPGAGAVTWTAPAGVTLAIDGNAATLAFASMTVDSATIKAGVTVDGLLYEREIVIVKNYAAGATYTWTKYGTSSAGAGLTDNPAGMTYIGQAFNKSTPTESTNAADYLWTLFKGTDGITPDKTGTAALYQWSVAAPAKPASNSTFTWASSSNTAYAGSDGWYIASALPANPGTPGMRLFVAAVGITAAAAATTTSVGYAASVITAYASNGADGPEGDPGADGLQSFEAAVYQWAATIPAAPAGSPTLTWSNHTFGAAPTNWTLTPAAPPGPGLTLWKAGVRVIGTAGASSTGFNWTSAAITATGSSGLNGTNGVACYVEISTNGGQVYSRANAAGTFAPASITLTATPYGGAASLYQWQYLVGTTWTSIAGATAATYAVASGAFTGSRVFRVQATIAGTVYTDEMTLVQVTGGTDGVDSITGFLTNESMSLAASNGGTVTSFAQANGTFVVYDGTVDKTGTAVTYSVFSETGCDVSITTAGVYSVASMSADQAEAILHATYGGVTIPKKLTLAKAKAGATTAGAEGASYVTAYCASATASTTTAPVATAGKTSVPAVNGGGITGTWSKTVPVLASGQFMYQSDGIYNPANDTVTWSIPYWSSLKVGSLSAITANLGAITGGSIDIGSGATSWHVDSLGNQWAGAASYGSAPFKVSNAGVLTATSGTFKGAVMGGGYTGWSIPTGGQTGFYLGPEGLALGNGGTTRYFQVEANGDVLSSQFTITNGVASFSGALSAATGTFKGDVMGGAYTTWGSPASGGIGYILSAQNGIAVGNYASGRYVILNSNGNIEAPGFNLIDGQLTLTSPVIISPTFEAFTASLSGGAITSSGANGTRSLGSRQIIGSGGKLPYRSFSWAVTDIEGNSAARTFISGENTDTVSVSASGTNAVTRTRITGTITDANGLTASASFTTNATFGTL